LSRELTEFLFNICTFAQPCSLPNDVSRWWLIIAELLAVAVLLVLAAVTGQTARALSANIDRQALADLALSDPLEVCINGAETLTGWVQNQGPLLLSPNFKWPNGTWYDPDPNYSDEKNASDTGEEQALFEVHRNNTSLDDMTLSAMYRGTGLWQAGGGLVAVHAG
jgi:hypothetical protein